MNQKELSFLYRGVLLLIAATGVVGLLSRADQPWAKNAGAIAGFILFFAFAAFVILVSFRQVSQFFKPPVRAEPLPKSLDWDRSYQLARLGVAAGVVLALAFLAVFLLVEPSKQCPNWNLPGKHAIPWWLLFLVWTVPILAGLSFIVARWDWVLRKAIESVDYPITIPIPYTVAMTVLAGCALAQLPSLELIGKCWLGG